MLRIAVPAVAAVMLLGASVAMALPDDEAPQAAPALNMQRATAMEGNVSRSLDVRPPLDERTGKKQDDFEPTATDHKFSTAGSLNIRTKPNAKAKVVTELDRGDKVAITGTDYGKWAEIVYKGEPRWVTGKYLSVKKPPKPKPKPAESTGVSGKPCASGSGVESGLQPATIKVLRAVCGLFPSITNYGGQSGGGDHAAGLALDVMTSNAAVGDQVAAYLQKNAAKLGVSELIWQQRIWTVQRGGEGWRSMTNRGSPTANHMDHVHVTTYG